MLKILTLALALTGVHAFAASNAAQIFAKGERLIEKYQADGQMDYILNPYVCANAKNEIVLVYTDDFRHKDNAYLIQDDLVMKVKTAKLELVKGASKFVEEYQVSEVSLKGEKLTCVASSLVLETPVPRGN